MMQVAFDRSGNRRGGYAAWTMVFSPRRDAYGDFRNLRVWQQAVALGRATYRITARMPPAEQRGLADQMRRAAVSVHANIAEGNARSTRADCLRFLDIARASLDELWAHAEFARAVTLLTPAEYDELHTAARHVAQLLAGLQRSHAARRRPEHPRR